MRTWYVRGDGARSAPRGLQKVLSEDQIQVIVRRETSRADRTGRHFSVVLFRVKPTGGRRWSVSACRLAKVMLCRVRQTDDVGWFDERHLCAVLSDTPAAGARVFASRTCDEVARRQPRPLAVVYGYPGGTSPDDEMVDIAGIEEIPHHGHVDEPSPAGRNGHARRTNGNGHRNGNGHANNHAAANGHGFSNGENYANGASYGNGASESHDEGYDSGPANGNAPARHNGRSRGANGQGFRPSHDDVNGHGGGAVALAEAPAENAQGLAEGERQQLVGYFLDGVSSAAQRGPARQSARPDAALEDLFVEPMPFWKRVLDLVAGTFGLLLLSPILLATAALIKLTSPGPVIFRQRRSGLGGREFTIYKFRTMCVDAERQQADLRKHNEQDGPAFKLTHDPRVTKIGHWLRKTSIDELPQLFNVIKGDMSLVGPRPLPVAEQGGCERWQRHRLNVTPGLTCIWQVAGRSEVTFDEWVRMDVAYMRQRSLWSDLSILFRTVPSVLLRRGAK